MTGARFMPPEADDRAFLVDMLEFAREAVDFSRGRSRADLDLDRAFLRSLDTETHIGPGRDRGQIAAAAVTQLKMNSVPLDEIAVPHG